VIGTGLFILLFPVASPFALALPVTALVNALMSLPFLLRALVPAVAETEARFGPLADSLGLTGAARLRLLLLPRLRRPLGFSLGLSAALSMGDLGVVALFAPPGGGTFRSNSTASWAPTGWTTRPARRFSSSSSASRSSGSSTAGAAPMLALEGLVIRQDDFRLEADLERSGRRPLRRGRAVGGGEIDPSQRHRGFFPAAAGRVLWNGKSPLDGLAPGDRPVSMVFQDNNLFPHLTAFQNVALGLRPR
jgi:hypothetical protein